MELIWDEKRKKHIRYYPPNDPEYYTEGLTNEDNEDGINEYAEDCMDYTETVYGYVPIEVVEKHGGIRT